jgi:branched-chain amino acid transport system ATP-binding protein
VLENVMIGRHVRTHVGFVSALFPGGATAREERETRERARELLQFVGLERRGRQRGTQLAVRRSAPG